MTPFSRGHQSRPDPRGTRRTDRLVKIHSIRTGELEHKIKKHTDWVTSLAFSPNGEFLVTGDRNGGISLWDADNAEELFSFAGHKSAVTALSWRDDSKMVASSSEDGNVKTWETIEGKSVKSIAAHRNGVTWVQFAHDGRWVSAGRDGSVRFGVRCTKARTFELPGEMALRCAFSHDAGRVIAGDFEGNVLVWNTTNGTRIGSLDINPPPLAEQLTAARHRIETLKSRESDPAPALTDASNSMARLEIELEAAKHAARKRRQNLRPGLRSGAIKRNWPQNRAPLRIPIPGWPRPGRRENRPAPFTPTRPCRSPGPPATGISPRTIRILRQNDPGAELPAADALLRRLTVAQAFAALWSIRESVVNQKRTVEGSGQPWPRGTMT